MPRPARDPVATPGGLRAGERPAASGTGVHIVKATTGPSCTGYSSQTAPPARIRVLVHNSSGAPTGVIQVPFQQYVENVLPNEWIASWDAQSLNAGAVAAKSYGWYWVNHYGGYFNTQSNCFDVTDDTNFQVYFANSALARTNTAVQTTWPVIARRSGEVIQAFYRAYLISSSEACGAGANGTVMSQYGSQACARAGENFSTILRTYYGADLELLSGPGSGSGAPTGPVSSPLGCVDIVNNVLSNGTPAVAAPCNGQPAQKFAAGSGTSLRLGSDISSWCLSVKSAGTTTGTPVRLYTCNGTGAQQWSWRADNSVFNTHSGLCLAVASSSTASNPPLQLDTCRPIGAQYWDLSLLQTARGAVSVGVAAPNQICVDDQDGRVTNRNPIQIYPCDGTLAQIVTVDAPTLRILGQCIDVAGAKTANRTKVQLYRCNASSAQQWTPRTNGSLLNPHSGKCLDDPGATTVASTQLQIYTCNGTAAQRFTLPG